MLGQVELGKTTPSIHVAWKIARALGVTFSILVDGIAETRPTLLRASTAKCMTSNGGSITTRALSTLGTRSAVAFYELRIGARSTQKAEPHAPGTRENVVVLQGTLGIRIASETHRLTPGDAIEFQADVAHDYCNEDDEVLLLYVVMTRSADCGTALSDFAHP
jgi:uncharacterized cupin superfamily protein